MSGLVRRLGPLGTLIVAICLPACSPKPGMPPATAAQTATAPASRSASTAATPSTGPITSTPASASASAKPHPIIVIDPGHAPAIEHVDESGLIDSDYENEPEMRDVFAVALSVRARLVAAGYRVVMTKQAVNDRVALGKRAAIANNAHAALAISIHDQAGSNGGIGFGSGNNIVYYQSVGDYRATPAGEHITFTNTALAATSARYAAIFATQRRLAQGTPITLQADTGYDLGTRGLAPGNIWIVQLLARVPWIYNEAGGNSVGQIGLSATDKNRYADGLVSGVEKSVPIG